MLQARTSETKPRNNLFNTIQVPQPVHQLHPCLGVTTTQRRASALGYESAPTQGGTRGPMDWADLHHTYGNQAVLRTLRSRLAPTAVGALAHRQTFVQDQGVTPRLQSKLAINTPGDQYEQEADRVAELVMRMPDPNMAGSPATASTAPVLQRKCASGGSGRGSGQCPECAKRNSSVQPLAPQQRTGCRRLSTTSSESLFGEDFTHVRLHHDGLAAQAATSVDALAFAVDHHIAFAEWAYSPATISGRRLLAHELTHVLQQRRTDDSSANPLGQGPLGQAPVGPVKLQRQSPPGPSQSGKELLPGSLGKFDEYDRRRFHESVLDGQGLTGNRGNDTALLAERFICDNFFTVTDPDPLFCLDSAVTRGRPVFSKYKAEVIEPEYDKILPSCIAIPRQPPSNTFFGQAIPGVSSPTLRSKLLEAQSKAMSAMCLNGQDPNAYRLNRTIITYGAHSPGEAKAVDINLLGQPYIMHEWHSIPKMGPDGKPLVGNDGKPLMESVPETDIDREVGPVYNRIAFWSNYRKSIIPGGITSVTQGSSSGGRKWTNPKTGKEPITTAKLYDMLKQESTGMYGYFNLLLKTDSDLTNEVLAFISLNTDQGSTLTGLGLLIDVESSSVQAFRKRIANDYRLLGGSYAQLEAFAGKPNAPSVPTLMRQFSRS